MTHHPDIVAEARGLAERLDFYADTGDMGRKPDPSSVTRRSAKALREAAALIEAQAAEIARLREAQGFARDAILLTRDWLEMELASHGEHGNLNEVNEISDILVDVDAAIAALGEEPAIASGVIEEKGSE